MAWPWPWERYWLPRVAVQCVRGSNSACQLRKTIGVSRRSASRWRAQSQTSRPAPFSHRWHKSGSGWRRIRQTELAKNLIRLFALLFSFCHQLAPCLCHLDGHQRTVLIEMASLAKRRHSSANSRYCADDDIPIQPLDYERRSARIVVIQSGTSDRALHQPLPCRRAAKQTFREKF